MTTGEQLRALADRCEAATGPDGELNQDIDEMIVCGKSGSEPRPFAPKFTSSLDAAMTLVPDQPAKLAQGHRWFFYINENTMPHYPLPPHMQWGYQRDTLFEAQLSQCPNRFAGRAATPALALCAASLRALAHTTETPK